MISLRRGAIKLPEEKRRNIKEKITRFLNGRFHILKGGPKRTPFLYTPKEISSVAGSVVHFCVAHTDLLHKVTPIYRLLDHFTPNLE